MAGTARRIVAIAALAGASLISTASPAAADHPLEPDLMTVKLSAKEMFVAQEGKRTVLRLANRVGNDGEGPLEIRPEETASDCDEDGDVDEYDLIGMQRIYKGDEWVPSLDPADNPDFDETHQVGCVVYHAAHLHWHVVAIAEYTLVSEATGEEIDGKKVGFCLGDSGRIDGGVPNGTYLFSGCGNSDTFPTVTGISPGYFDLYGAGTPGQRVNVTGLEPGRYCLRSTANPEGKVLESDPADNVAEIRLRLNPERQVVRKVSRDCVPPASP
jgi:hypothetical protein